MLLESLAVVFEPDGAGLLKGVAEHRGGNSGAEKDIGHRVVSLGAPRFIGERVPGLIIGTRALADV